MPDYAAEVVSKSSPSEVVRVIVGSPEWAEQNLGGEWVPTVDPYSPDPDNPRRYTGAGQKFDPGVPEAFCSDEWTTAKGTQMQSDGAGGFFWFYNTQGQLTWYQGRIWRNLSPTGTPNVWAPGVANWREYPLDGGVPVWVQPVGAVDAYPLGFRVKHNGQVWESTIPANVWAPGSTGAESLWETVQT